MPGNSFIIKKYKDEDCCKQPVVPEQNLPEEGSLQQFLFVAEVKNCCLQGIPTGVL